MKRLFFALLALISVFSLQAQESFTRQKPIVSPEINQDGSVTFRFYAPKAVTVEILGDFLPKDCQAWMTEKEGGIWEYKTEPLNSELYYYTYKVDGRDRLDPMNAYMVRDIASHMNIFIVLGRTEDSAVGANTPAPGDLYAVQDVPHGTVSRVWYDSPTLGKTRRMTIYTPAGYEDSKKTSYPVLYLLHGMGGDEEAWLALGRVAQIMDNLIACGKAKPMIVVMPNGNTKHKAAPGYSDEGMFKPYFCGSMDGTYEPSFPDIIKYVESHYRVIKKKSARAICGLSMGGFHSLHISKQFPDMFDYVGLFSAAIFPGTPKEGESLPEVYQNMDGKLATQFSKNPKLYWIGIGKEDFLIKSNNQFREILDQNHYPYEYYESEGGHIWRNWRVYLTMFSQKLF